MGIAEQHAVTLAAGLATQGMRPVFAVYSTFLQRAYDQMIHDVCMQQLPVIFAVDRAGLVGQDGETHHGVFDLSYLQHMPNITIMAPKNGHELRAMMYEALEIDGPVAIRYPRGSAYVEHLDRTIITDLSTEYDGVGSDVTLLTVGTCFYQGQEVLELLQEKGISGNIVRPYMLKPYPVELDKTLQEAKCIVVLEDNARIGGFGATLLDRMNQLKISNDKMILLGYDDQFICHGEVSDLLDSLGRNPSQIAECIVSHLKESK